MSRPQLALAVLAVLAVGASLLSRQPGSDSPFPSISNTGPRGAAVLATWLREAGVEVVPLDHSFDTPLDAHIKTVVIAAPTLSELTKPEVATLQSFVREGGTLVYLAPRGHSQPALNQWLGLSSGEIAPLSTEPGLEDVGGSTVQVRFPGDALAGLRAFRVSADRMVKIGHDVSAVPTTSTDSLWWLRDGKGDVWIGAGADLIENARLELFDNSAFWAALARRGPIAFDEYHLAPHGAGLPLSITTTLLQLVFLAALFLWARAQRLGPVRDPLVTEHRSSLEYVEAMAALTTNARVEESLTSAIKLEFRRRLEEARGLSRALSWGEVGRELERMDGVPAVELEQAATEADFSKASRALATLERRLLGRR